MEKRAVIVRQVSQNNINRVLGNFSVAFLVRPF